MASANISQIGYEYWVTFHEWYSMELKLEGPGSYSSSQVAVFHMRTSLEYISTSMKYEAYSYQQFRYSRVAFFLVVAYNHSLANEKSFC